MKRLFLSCILLAATCSFANAQTDSVKIDSTRTDTTISVPVKQKKERKVYNFPKHLLGIRGGVNYSNIVFSDVDNIGYYDVYKHHPQYFGIIGIYGQFQLGNSPFSIRPEVTYISRGDSLTWCDVKYSFETKYIDFRLPLTLNIRFKHSRVSPYLMVVPQVGMAFDGSVYYRDEIDYFDGVTVQSTNANVRDIDASVMFGAGFDYLIKAKGYPIMVSLEGGYNMGFLNTFANRERYANPNVIESDRSIIDNPLASKDLWQGARKNRGIEVAMRLGFPIDGSWKKNTEKPIVQRTDTLIVSDSIHDTVYIVVESPVHDTIIQYDTVCPEEPNVPIVSRDNYVVKDCYSIKEFMAYLVLGEDVSDKRICLFNIHFAFNKAILRDVSKPPLRDVAQMMKLFPEMRVKIMGHTDSRGSDEYNDWLSLERAKSVVEFLASLGISRDRLIPEGYGEHFPIDESGTEEGHEKNRRVEIEVLNVGVKLTDESAGKY
ncbi:MAG: OmpA family protein [Bacteroidales bacterium]|nr:OmpA family protein [Bacteroidales bacterium]